MTISDFRIDCELPKEKPKKLNLPVFEEVHYENIYGKQFFTTRALDGKDPKPGHAFIVTHTTRELELEKALEEVESIADAQRHNYDEDGFIGDRSNDIFAICKAALEEWD